MDTKSRIMEEAFKLFLKKGFDDVSLSEIKQASNITTGGFYHYFKSKDDLLIAVIEKYVFNYFNSTIEQIKEYEGTPKEKIKTAITSILGDTQLSDSEIIDYKTLHLLLMEGVKKYEIINEHYSEFFHSLLNFIKDVLDEGKEEGIIRQDIDSTQLAIAIQTLMVGNILMGIAMPEISLEDRISYNIDNLWEYITK